MMKLYRYANKKVKRIYRKATLTREEFEKLYEIANEWLLVEVGPERAIFKPKIPEPHE
jgi:hypothetical protein